ncbi:MAG: sensor histidine kinase [Acidaminobacteraceae bacterium]
MVNTKQKIILTVVLLSLFATATTGGFSVFYILGIIKENTHRYLSENAKSYGNELDGVIISLEVTVDTLLKTVTGVIDKDKIDDPNYFYELSERVDSIVTEFDRNSINAMSVYIRFDPDISYGTAGVFHADTDGDGVLEKLIPTDITLYDKDDTEHVGWFYDPIKAREAIWTDPYYNANIDTNMVSYISPIIIDGKIIGVIGIDINFAQLSDITKRKDQDGNVILVDQKYRFLVHDVYDINDTIYTIENGMLGYAANIIEMEKYGTIEYVLNGEDKILGFSVLKNNWAVLVALSQKEAFVNLNKIVLILLIINSFITLIVIILAIFIGRYLSSLISRNSELKFNVEERTKELSSTNMYLEISMAELESNQSELTVLNEQLENSLIQVREMQDKIVMTEKLDSLGELVAGIAHEINTPLGVCITTNSFALSKIEKIKVNYESETLSKLVLSECIEESLSAINMTATSLKQMVSLVDAFKDVTLDKQIIDIKKINLRNHLLSIVSDNDYKLLEMGHSVELLCDENIEIVTYPRAIRLLINQLISNSIIHGFEDQKNMKILIEITRNNRKIEIIYSDNGKGIAENISKKIFEPFYTTKKNKGSVGLGLHSIYNLVSKTLNGELEFKSKQGSGVEFIIRFESIKL